MLSHARALAEPGERGRAYQQVEPRGLAAGGVVDVLDFSFDDREAHGSRLGFGTL